MNEKDSWMQFVSTGSVLDFLKYVDSQKQVKTDYEYSGKGTDTEGNKFQGE